MSLLKSLRNLIPGSSSATSPTSPGNGLPGISSSLSVTNQRPSNPQRDDTLMLDRNIGQHKHAAEATLQRARWMKHNNITSEDLMNAMPFPGNTSTTTVKNAGILPMLAGAATVAATAAGVGWMTGLFDKVKPPVTNPPAVVQPATTPVAPVAPAKSYDATIDMEVIPPPPGTNGS